MKGGLAVMLDLATTVPEPSVDVTWCFYAREEISRNLSGLFELWERRPELLAGTPRSWASRPSGWSRRAARGRCECRSHCAACGRIRRARSPVATRSIAWRRCCTTWPTGPREVVLDGCTYVEQLQVVSVEGGVAANVVPDEARVTLNHRYAPDRTEVEAQAFLHELLDPLLSSTTATPGRCWTPATARPRR